MIDCRTIVKATSDKRRRSIPTLQMIAKESGVSRETVSHILGGKLADRYKDSTRAKVMEVAGRLNYRPHRGAQAMKAGRSNVIAIVHFGAGIEAAHKTNLALSRMVNEKGYDYLAMDMNWCDGGVERTLAEIIRARVEGVLISHIQDVFMEHHVAELRRAGIPVVSVNGSSRTDMPLICDNVRGAFRGLTRHLLDQGHRRILHLMSSISHLDTGRARSINERMEGFREAIETRGKWRSCSEAEFFATWPSLSFGPREVVGITVQQDSRLYELLDKPVYKFCSRLFPGKKLPDAMVCTNDLYAMEVIAAGLERGLRIPGDMAITGYDNDRIGEFPAFGITTAEQDIEGICSAAVNVLMQQIANIEEVSPNQAFDSRIIIRSSSGRESIPASKSSRHPKASRSK